MVRISSIATLLILSFTNVLARPPGRILFPRVSIRQTGNATTINAGSAAIGKGKGAQFTVGGCINDADCASGCCAGGAISGATGREGVGICSAEGGGVEFQKGKTGCGFVDPNAALTLEEAAAQIVKQGF